MSDFLSNFSKENYDGEKLTADTDKGNTVNEKTTGGNEKEATVSRITEEQANERQSEPKTRRKTLKSKAVSQPTSRFGEEESEFDPTYQRRKKKKYLLLTAILAGVIVIGLIAHYQLTHVTLPNFVGKEISEVRSWGAENDVVIKVTQKTDFERPVNQVIAQQKKAKKIKKGQTLKVETSLGPDPDEVLKLPDFTQMTYQESEQWRKDHKAENLTLVQQFNETVEKDHFIKREFTNPELTDETYRRKDSGRVYFSKGKEVFQATIDVPEFSGKNLSEVTAWAKEHNLEVKMDKAFSDTVAKDLIISQEITKGTKVAQKSAFKVQVSSGKGLKVPDFSQYTFTEASALENKIPTVIKTTYSETIPYGSFISQSVDAQQHFGEQDELPLVQVVYSEGKPYLKDLRGSVNEGELPKLFYETFTSKGANITYQVYDVSSAEAKGTVVEMSRFGEFLPLTAQIKIGISLGNLKPDPAIPAADNAAGDLENTDEKSPAENPATPEDKADSSAN